MLYRRTKLPERSGVSTVWNELGQHALHAILIFSGLGPCELLRRFKVCFRTSCWCGDLASCGLGAAELRRGHALLVQLVFRNFWPRGFVALHRSSNWTLVAPCWILRRSLAPVQVVGLVLRRWGIVVSSVSRANGAQRRTRRSPRKSVVSGFSLNHRTFIRSLALRTSPAVG